MKRITLLGTILGAMVMFVASCGGSSGSSSGNSGGHAKGTAPTTQESTMQASYSPSINLNIATGHDSYEHWREGDHDDLVLAAAMAVWSARRPQPTMVFV